MYEKPIIIKSGDIAEGVFMASGGEGCYTTTARIHQKPETGRGDYRIQVDGHHNADHNCNAQVLTISFNQPVVYKSCNGNGAQYLNGNDTNTLQIGLTYWQNHTDNIGFGDLCVESDPGLEIVDVSIDDVNGRC